MNSVRIANFPLIFAAIVPTSLIASLTLLGTLFMPRSLVLGLSGAFGLRFLWTLWSERDSLNDPRILKGRRCANITGDFVVFLIGMRHNKRDFPITSNFKRVGDEMSAIEQELLEHPEYGCLGSETFIGANTEGSTTLLVQYWRSVDQLQAYAASSQNRHYSPWKNLMRLGKSSTEIGFWHETFAVQQGAYEAIYVNCPVIGLANARGAASEPAAYGKSTMKGRLGRGTGDAAEWPDGFKSDSFY